METHTNSQNFRNVKVTRNKFDGLRKCNQKRISYKERMEDALALSAEEGRDKLR